MLVLSLENPIFILIIIFNSKKLGFSKKLIKK